jgi:hypothetical protein
MPNPSCVIIVGQPYRCRPPVIAKPQNCFREIRRLNGIADFCAETGDLWIGAVGRSDWFIIHLTHLGGANWKDKYGGSPHPAFAQQF